MEKHEIDYTPQLWDYIHRVSVRESAAQRALREETLKDPYAVMQIPPEQGQFLAFLTQAIGARRVLEVGTYTGYSALTLAQAIPADGRLVTLDRLENWRELNERFWTEAGVRDRIEFRLGEATTSLQTLIDESHAGSFDLAFIDADKPNLDAYYEHCLTLLRPGGVIAIDNVLLFGAVVDRAALPPELSNLIGDDAIQAVQRINDKVAGDARVDVCMLPLGDGLTLARKR